MHEDDVTDRALLDEIIGERFPHWRGVLNEAARSRAAQARQSNPLTGPPVHRVVVRDHGDTDLIRFQRRKQLNEAMPPDQGHGDAHPARKVARR